jgi:hypothetical protein
MFGRNLARQIEELSDDAGRTARISDLARQIEEDQESLSALMERMGVAKNPVKQITTWLGEKASRVKLTGLSSGEGGLSLSMALETLSLGVEGKAALWRALREVEDRYAELDARELDTLMTRAAGQREVLEAKRLVVARQAFTNSDAE